MESVKRPADSVAGDYGNDYRPKKTVEVIKKDGSRETFNVQKVVDAVDKSAYRALTKFTDDEKRYICKYVVDKIDDLGHDEVPISIMHNIVESALEQVKPLVAKSYRDYRNYKQDFVRMLDEVYKKSQSIMYIGDKENSNTDSALVATKRSLIFNQLNKELYQKFFMTTEEIQACRDGYIYVHDMSARRDTMNCALFDVKNVLSGGFEMGNIWYNEPKSLDTAFDVIGDVTLSAASQQYGGFTLPEVDKILEPYAEKSYAKYVEKYTGLGIPKEKAEEVAYKDVEKEFEQGFQGWEYKFNTVGSSRGDYPFITISAGLGTGRFAKMASIIMLNVRKNGQGKKGHKKPVLFPKVVFLYDENLHGPGKPLEDVFEAGIQCSLSTMYPDWLSLTGKGYVSEIYKKYGKVISPMGCVDGQEVVTYKFKGNSYRMSIKDMWHRMAHHFKVKEQPAGPEHLYMDLKGVEMWDMKKGWVNTERMNRNKSKDWTSIVLENGYTLRCTIDHPLTTSDGITKRADKLILTDYLDVVPKDDMNVMWDNESSRVSEIQLYTDEDFSYDVTTESAHFDVSGIWSHNCRAFLSPWYERGGMEPADKEDKPVFVGRFNIGAVSLHLPMILAKARHENKDFYEVLDYYLNLIRQLHIRTYAYLGEMRASTNPLAYCEGGFLGGNLGLHDKIKPLLKSATASFGITALNELQMLYNGKSLVQDGAFALEVMDHINEKVNEFKKADGRLYALYGTPAERLCFDGDTIVQCYGGNKRIADIKVGDLVYSFNEQKHKVELKPVTRSMMTKKNAEVVKVVFDNGQHIICTPDHPIGVRVMSQNGKGQFTGERLEYIKAKDLVKDMRIKSNYIYVNKDGRYECSNYYNGKHQLIQDVNAEYAYGEKPEGSVTHHKDEVKTNNEFGNLEYMTGKEHRIHHMGLTIGQHQYKREDVLGEKNPFYGKTHTAESKNKNRIAHMGRSVCALSNDGTVVKEFECANDVMKDGFTRHMVVMACRGKSRSGDHTYRKMQWYYKDDCPVVAKANHKVESVEYLSEAVDVYDITVEDNHNFFAGGDDGILVHNCGLQIEQFRKKYGIIEGVSDRDYVSNSFHCHVTEDITPIQKQDLEYRFWDKCNGGKIQYVKYPINYNIRAVKTLVRRAMEMGFYEGVNLSLAYCDDCGHQELEMDVCPKCGSKNLTKIDRMNGYLSYSRVHGDTRLNDAKMAEIAERKSM